MTDIPQNGEKLKEKINIHERLAKLEVKVDEILHNHLPHLYNRVNWILGILITGLLSVIFLLLK